MSFEPNICTRDLLVRIFSPLKNVRNEHPDYIKKLLKYGKIGKFINCDYQFIGNSRLPLPTGGAWAPHSLPSGLPQFTLFLCSICRAHVVKTLPILLNKFRYILFSIYVCVIFRINVTLQFWLPTPLTLICLHKYPLFIINWDFTFTLQSRLFSEINQPKKSK